MLSALLLVGLATQGPIQVRFVDDEPKAALAILGKANSGQTVTDEDWSQLFATEGYTRLKKREAAFKRPFTDDEFKGFLLSDQTKSKASGLAKALQELQNTDWDAVGKRPLAYLPKSATIKASVYPLIKPKPNSFVWEVDTNPAIMLYLDPEKSAEEVRTTAAHELHHIGYGTCCPSKAYKAWFEKLPPAKKSAMEWLSALGEGFAVLCQKGGPSDNPYGDFDKETADAWRDNYPKAPEDMAKLEAFFLDVLAGKLTGDKLTEQAFSFFGMLGPWYTVGYYMALTIEQVKGREALIECYLDPRRLLRAYNDSAKSLNRKDGGKRPLWPASLVRDLR